jgi:hypothetical protein
VRDVRDALPREPERASSSTPRREWTITRSTMLVDAAARVQRRTVVPRQGVMSREDRRRLGRDASQPAHVEARQREPLHVHDVRLELVRRRVRRPDARQVLEPLDDVAASATAWIAREYPAADRQEELVAPIADRLGNGPERKGRREQIDGCGRDARARSQDCGRTAASVLQDR